MTSPASEQTESVCYRHSSRPTNVSCSNCGRPICPDCMRSTPVGFRCPECAPKQRYAMADDLLVTKAVIGVNVAVFVIGFVLTLANGAMAGLLGASNANDLFTQGALVPGYVYDGEWWRIVTAGFLHAGLLHIGFNMFFIWSFGGLIEPALGRARYALLYIVSLVGGSVGALVLSPVNSATVGASGAAFGLLGAALVMANLRQHAQLQSSLMTVALFNLGLTFLIPGISIGGHVGGFVVGAACGWLLYGPLARAKGAALGAMAALAVVLFVVAIVVADVRVSAALGL